MLKLERLNLIILKIGNQIILKLKTFKISISHKKIETKHMFKKKKKKKNLS